MTLGTDTITVLRATPGAEDDFGNPTSGVPVGTTVLGCSVQPIEGDEATVGRDTVVSRWRVWAPVGTDLKATDRVRYDGDVYEVDGEVQRWDSGTLPHVTALLRRSS